MKRVLKRAVSLAVAGVLVTSSLPSATATQEISIGPEYCAGVNLNNVARRVNSYQFSNISEREIYLLAKITMCEAGNQDMLGKELIVRVVLNRVNDDTPENNFPDTIEEVIFQPGQFAPLSSASWQQNEPTEECYEAVYNVIYEISEDTSQGALYFESGASWHKSHLQWLFKHGGHNFYKNY